MCAAQLSHQEEGKASQRQLLFLFMKRAAATARKISALIDAGTIRPIVDRVFPFEQTKEAMPTSHKDTLKGKVVVAVR